MRVAIVNDLELAIVALRRMLALDPGLELAWIARDGHEAVARARTDTPDLILMDLVMPVMDGVEATRRIMQETPCSILIVTATVEGNISRVYNALSAGALDAINGPTFSPDGSLAGGDLVLRKLRSIARLVAPATVEPPRRRPSSGATFVPSGIPECLVVIGASTGGPQAIVDVVSRFSPTFRPPLVVVQHLDEDFVPGFVSWLAAQTQWDVCAAGPGDVPAAGRMLVACSRDHLVMGRNRTLRYERDPADYPYRPSVDVFFSSLVHNWPSEGVAVVLTGMGQDGARGLKALRDVGWVTLAQDRESSIVYGMPRAAWESGAAMETTRLGEMGARVEQVFGELQARRAARARNGS